MAPDPCKKEGDLWQATRTCSFAYHLYGKDKIHTKDTSSSGRAGRALSALQFGADSPAGPCFLALHTAPQITQICRDGGRPEWSKSPTMSHTGELGEHPGRQGEAPLGGDVLVGTAGPRAEEPHLQGAPLGRWALSHGGAGGPL